MASSCDEFERREESVYDGWRVARWETPVADVERLLMVSLVDANRELVLTFEGPESQGRPRWRVTFRGYPAYRNIAEKYRLRLWRWLTESDQRCGYTVTVVEEPPLASWHTGYLHDQEPGTRHFVIMTDDDVVEVLSCVEPVWESIEPARPEDPPPGKSTHLYWGEDQEAIDRVFEDIKSRNRTH